MYVCMVTHHKAIVWINRVRLPTRGQLNSGNCFFPVPVRSRLMREFGLARRIQQSRPASACSSPYSGWIWCLITTGFLPSSVAASIYSFKTAIHHPVSPEFIGSHAIAYRWRLLPPRVRRHRASKPQGSSERVLPWQGTMDQLICASLSYTHYWYEVGHVESGCI